MIHKKSSISSTKPSAARTTLEEEVGVEEEDLEVEEEAVAAVVEAVQDLLHNLSQSAKAKLLFQLQQTLEPWVRNQQSLQAIAPKRTISSRKLKHTSVSTKTSPGLILLSRKSPLPSPLSREMKSPDGSKTWVPELMDSITSTKTSPLYGPNSSTNSKPSSKISTNNNEPGWHSTNAACSGRTSPSTYPTLKNMLDRPDTPRETPKQPTYSSKDFPPEYWQMYSNLLTLRDTKIPSKKQSTLPSLSFYWTPSSLLSEATLLLKTLEVEETRLRALRHLLEETHRIAHSSNRTEEEDGTVTNDLAKEEEDKDNNDPNITPPTHRDG